MGRIGIVNRGRIKEWWSIRGVKGAVDRIEDQLVVN